MQAVDYNIVLPALTGMPPVLGGEFSKLRGILHGTLDYEWRSAALGLRFVREKTYQSMQSLMPGAGKRNWMLATLRRFAHDSRVEWQNGLFGREVMEIIARKSNVEHLEDLLRIENQGRGLVMFSCHFDSFMMGMVLLGMNGLHTNVITSAVIEDERVHPAVRRFYARYYKAMELHTGGKLIHKEVDLPYFEQALERGETVVNMGDIPGNKSNVLVNFLGRRFKVPLGLWHMARRTNSALGAFVCLYESPGRYRVACLPPRDVDSSSPLESMRPIYAFLEKWIRKLPHRWTAADLWPGYGESE
jgi:lauroyl/myristoyl acyltransferase